MRIIMSLEEIERWVALYQNTNPPLDSQQWKKDLINTIVVCLQACFLYHSETSHLTEKEEPHKTIRELSNQVLDLLIHKAAIEGVEDDPLDITEEPDCCKDYEEEYRLMLEDILTTFYIFTGKIDITLVPGVLSPLTSRINLEVSNTECIIDILPKEVVVK